MWLLVAVSAGILRFMDNSQRADFRSRGRDGGRHFAASPRVGNHVEDHGERGLDQRGRGDGHLPVDQRQIRQLAADIDAGVDVFASVDAVARGPDDFRHIGPHRIETRPAERPAVARPRNRNPPRLGLKPRGEDDIGREIAVAQPAVLRVNDPGEDVLGAVLHAVQAALALIDVVEKADFLVQGFGLVAIQAVDAPLLHAVMATGAILAPVDDAQFADGPHAGSGRLGMNGVLGRHG